MIRHWLYAALIFFGLSVPALGATIHLVWNYTLHPSVTMGEMGDFVLETASTATGKFTELVRRPAVVDGAFDVTETVDVTFPRCFRVYATANAFSGRLTSAKSNVLCKQQLFRPTKLRGGR